MPDPFERRSRPNGCCEGLYSQPSRSQLRSGAIAADVPGPAKKAPGKKDPALCKAAHWKGPHVPELRMRDFGWHVDIPCRWDVSWFGDEPRWSCRHEEVCAGCGKVLRVGIGSEECPDWHPMTGAERLEVDAEIARHREHRAARAERKPVITGPQGYRKRRSA
jgi:predicted Fe-S protein YdhL (DUF1289 family)